MKTILLSILMIVAGAAVGVGAGVYLGGAPQDELEVACPSPDHEVAAEMPAEPVDTAHDYARLNNQFVVPVVEQGAVTALVSMTLSLEISVGTQEAVFTAEPKLRDVLLQAMFDHANIGGFEGAFTDSSKMRNLRSGLLHAAQEVLGQSVSDVLVIDIIRQDM